MDELKLGLLRATAEGPNQACNWWSADTWSRKVFLSQHRSEFNIESRYSLVSLRSILIWDISSRVFLQHLNGHLKDDLSKA